MENFFEAFKDLEFENLFLILVLYPLIFYTLKLLTLVIKEELSKVVKKLDEIAIATNNLNTRIEKQILMLELLIKQEEKKREEEKIR